MRGSNESRAGQRSPFDPEGPDPLDDLPGIRPIAVGREEYEREISREFRVAARNLSAVVADHVAEARVGTCGPVRVEVVERLRRDGETTRELIISLGSLMAVLDILLAEFQRRMSSGR